MTTRRVYILKNNTGSDGLWIGRFIAAGEYREIEPVDYFLWLQSQQVLDDIQAGNLIVNDGTNDLSPSVGYIYFTSEIPINPEVPGSQYITIPLGDTASRPSSATEGMIRYNTDDDCIEGYINGAWGCLTNTIDTTGISEIVKFSNTGYSNDKWLSMEGPSNEAPKIIPFDCVIYALTFVNSKDNAYIDIKLYKNDSLVFTWDINNSRYAYKTNGLSSLTFSAGDRLSVFADNAPGSGPHDVVVHVSYRFTHGTSGEGGGSSL